MSADYTCPQCNGRLANAGAANAWRCTRESCEKVVVEVVDGTRHRVREFYRRATDQWEGLRG